MINGLSWVLFRFVLIYSVLIGGTVAHEFGHYFAARCTRCPVLKFTIGDGSLLFSRYVSHTLFELRSGMGSGGISCDVVNNAPWKYAFICLSGPLMDILFGVLVVGVSVLNHWDILYGVTAVGVGAYSFVQFGPNSDVKKAFKTLLDEDVFLRSSVRLLFRVSYGALIFVLCVVEVAYIFLWSH